MGSRSAASRLILLDTHVVLWWASGDSRLSSRAEREIAKADDLLISPVSCWEIATLVRMERIRLDRDVYVWIDDLFGQDRVRTAQVSPQIAVAAGLLPSRF